MKQTLLASAFLLAFTMTLFGQDLGDMEQACGRRKVAKSGPGKYECRLRGAILNPQEQRAAILTVIGPDEIEWELFHTGPSALFGGDVTSIAIVVNGSRRWEIPATRNILTRQGATISEQFQLNVTRDVALEIAAAKTVTIEIPGGTLDFPADWKPGIKDAVSYMDRVQSGNFASTPKTQFDTRGQAASCALDDIEIKVVKAGFVNVCQTRECWQLKGVAVLTNKCRESVVVEAKIIGYAQGMKPVAARDFYPGGTNSIPPGEFVISLDGMLGYDPEIYVFYVKAIGGRMGQ